MNSNEQETSLYLLECLADSMVNPNGKRARKKKTPFRIINSIYLFTKRMTEKGNSREIFPGKALLAKMSGCSISEVTKFITSKEIDLFCEVKREKFKSNTYILKEWVFCFFRLFWRSGMMKEYNKDYDRWIGDFKKRIRKWLVPLLQSGVTMQEIWQSVLNKLSTRNPVKKATTTPLKEPLLSPTEYMKPLGSKLNSEDGISQLPFFVDSLRLANEMKNRFSMREADINTILRGFSLSDVKGGFGVHIQRLQGGLKPKSQVATMIHAIQTYRQNKPSSRI